jgi:hypothetical protein
VRLVGRLLVESWRRVTGALRPFSYASHATAAIFSSAASKGRKAGSLNCVRYRARNSSCVRCGSGMPLRGSGAFMLRPVLQLLMSDMNGWTGKRLRPS